MATPKGTTLAPLTYRVQVDPKSKGYTVQTVPASPLTTLNHRVQLDPKGKAYTITTVPAKGSKAYALTVPSQNKRVTISQPFLDVRKLMNSMSGAQRANMQRRGYITYDELSPDQKKMIAVPKEGNWTISYSVNGETIKIKSR